MPTMACKHGHASSIGRHDNSFATCFMKVYLTYPEIGRKIPNTGTSVGLYSMSLKGI